MALTNPYGAMARCIMNADKSIDCFLDPNNSNKKMDGTAVDWTTVANNGQNVMVQIPKFYFAKKWDDVNKAFFFGVSSEKKDTQYIKMDDWAIHPAFYRDVNSVFNATCDPTKIVEVDYRYCGAFPASIDAKGRLRSVPSALITTKTIDGFLSDFRQAANKMGVGFMCFDFYLLYALQLLVLTEFGHADCNSIFSGGSNAITSENTGYTLTSGNNTAKSDGNAMSYRGIENIQTKYPVILENSFCTRSTGPVWYLNVSSNIMLGNPIKFNTIYNYESTDGYGEPLYSCPGEGYITNIRKNPLSGFMPITSNPTVKSSFGKWYGVIISSNGVIGLVALLY